MRPARRFLPNGCTSSPDRLGEVDWKGCCDLHDLSYHVGGWRRLVNGEKLLTDFELAACMAGRWWRSADERVPWWRRLGRRLGAVILPPVYMTAVVTVGSLPIFWSWRERPVPSHEALLRLEGVDHEQLARLARTMA